MGREYRDRVTDSTNNSTVYQLVDEATGSTIAARVQLVPVNVVEEGDQFGARAINRVLELDADGTPMLALDGGTVKAPTGWQTQYRQDGGILPEKLLPAQLFVADNGDVYVGDADNNPVQLGNLAAIVALQRALNLHAGDKNNPHGVTLEQLGAAAASALKAHVENKSNSHGVTAAQTKAIPLSGSDAITGVLISSSRIQGTTLRAGRTDSSKNISIYVGGTSADTGVVEINSGTGPGLTNLLFRNGATAGLATCVGNFTSSSSRKIKKNIKEIDDSVVEALISRAQVTEFAYKKAAGIDPSGAKHYGLIAEDLDKIDPTFVARSADGSPAGISYFEMVPVLLRTLQLQDERIRALEAKL